MYERGRRIGNYEVVRALGSGGQGIVYLCRHVMLDRLDAVKVLLAHTAGNAEARARFEREAAAAARLRHPNIVTVYDAGTADDGDFYVAMQFIDGLSLDRLIMADGVADLARTLRVLDAIAAALDAAHTAGLIHRDVKPNNILLSDPMTPDEQVYLVDFGIAKLVAESRDLTMSQVMGTYGYMAPERIDGESGDGRADQYSLACTAYQCLTGALPFPATSTGAVIKGHLLTPPPAVTIRRADLPAAVDQVLGRAMAKAPAERYPTCRAFVGALREALAGNGTAPPLAATTRRRAAPTVIRPVEVPPTPLAETVSRKPAGDVPHETVPVNAASSRRRNAFLVAAVAIVLAGGASAYALWPSAGVTPQSPAAGSSTSARVVGSAHGVSAAAALCGYHLAFIGPLTGSLGSLGSGMAQGAQLAVDQFNARHGTNCVRLIRYDSQASSTRSASAAALVVKDSRMLGVIGPTFSPESETADPILNSAGIPLVTPGATFSDLSTQQWQVFHRAIGDDDDVPPAAARYIRDVLGATRVYIVDDGSPYGTGLAGGVRSALGDLVAGSGAVARDGKQKDFTATVNAVLRSGATVLFYGGYYTNAGRLRRQLTTAGWHGVLVGGDAMRDPRFVAAAGSAAAQGTLVIAPDPPISAARGTFAADFQAVFGTPPINSSDVSYDIANMFLQGIDAGRTSTASMLTWIDSYDGDGVAGHYKFTAGGDLQPSDSAVWVYTVTNGVFTASGRAPSL